MQARERSEPFHQKALPARLAGGGLHAFRRANISSLSSEVSEATVRERAGHNALAQIELGMTGTVRYPFPYTIGPDAKPPAELYYLRRCGDEVIARERS